MSDIFTKEMAEKRMAGFKKFAVVVTVGLCFFSVVVGGHAYVRATKILSDFSPAEAIITKAQHRVEEGKKGRLKDIYEIKYQFTANSKNYVSEFQTSRELFEKYKNAGVVDVAYSNSDPSEFDRYSLLITQASLLDFGLRFVMVMLAVIAILSLMGFVIKIALSKKIGKPLAEMKTA